MKKVSLVLLICSRSLVLSACKSHDDSVEREGVSDFTVATIEYPYSELLNWVSAKYQYFDYELICE